MARAPIVVSALVAASWLNIGCTSGRHVERDEHSGRLAVTRDHGRLACQPGTVDKLAERCPRILKADCPHVSNPKVCTVLKAIGLSFRFQAGCGAG